MSKDNRAKGLKLSGLKIHTGYSSQNSVVVTEVRHFPIINGTREWVPT